MFSRSSLASLFALIILLAASLGARPLVARAEPPSEAEAVIAWNAIARRTSITVARQPVPLAQVSLAYVQAAVYDAVIAIEGGYQPYADPPPVAHPNASVAAAVATAAHAVLVKSFPDQRVALDADYTAALAAIPDGASKNDGKKVGRAAAAGLLKQRKGDGFNASVSFTMPSPAPGVWQLPADQSALAPWYAHMHPFLIARPDQFRPGPPPALDSRTWVVQFAEVKAYGGTVSAERSAEQTDVALFWSTMPIMQNNIAYQDVARAHRLSAAQTARLFAIGNLVGADAGIACFDAKYHYLFWRPQFAIPAGESDGNPRTVGDPAWTPLIPTPPHPEYPAAHGCNIGAQAEVFAAVLGTNQIEVDLTSTTQGPMPTVRHYARVTDLVHEIVDARVWGGVHYRASVKTGVVMGRQVASWVLKRHFLPQR